MKVTIHFADNTTATVNVHPDPATAMNQIQELAKSGLKVTLSMS